MNFPRCRQCLLLLSLFVCPLLQGATLQGTISGSCLSIAFGRSGATVFTTFDGQLGVPVHLFTNNVIVTGGEVRPRDGGTNIYETDYLYAPNSFVEGYGSLFLEIPLTDANGNGLPDLLERGQAIKLAANARYFTEWPDSGSVDATGSFERTAGAAVGSYVIRTASSGAVSHSGALSILDFTGPMRYDRLARTINFTLTVAGGGQALYTATAATTFTVISSNQVELQPFILTSTAGNTAAQTVILTRVGNAYRGRMKLGDAYFNTPYSDYRDWIIELVDSNDTDQDGIPNLSDSGEGPTLRSFTPAGASLTLLEGATLELRAEAAGAEPISYIWRKDGTTLQSSTSGTFSRTSIGASDAGTYSLVLSNAFGAIVARTVQVAVTVKPSVAITAPQSGALFLVPGPIPLQLSFSNVAGRIVRTEIFANNIKAGEIAGTGTNLTLLLSAPGVYTLRATTYNSLGQSGTSSEISISISPESAAALRIHRSGSRTEVIWPYFANMSLQRVLVLTTNSPWETLSSSNVVGGTNYIMSFTNSGSAFFRLRKN